jgi:tight adherence protein C
MQAVCGIAAALATACGFFAIVSPRAGWPVGLEVAAAMGLCAAVLPRLWLRQLVRRRSLRISRELPFVLDITTLCVESGLNLHGALLQASERGPDGPLRDELTRALADMRAGAPRLTALKAMATRAGSRSVRAWVAALTQAETMGISLGSILRTQAAQCRAERFQRAEKLAMEAPVKMLLPLIGCIFPCTFIILGFPIVLELLQGAR